MTCAAGVRHIYTYGIHTYVCVYAHVCISLPEHVTAGRALTAGDWVPDGVRSVRYRAFRCRHTAQK